MSFVQKYQRALSFKPRDVEEAIDVHFHRPIAAAVTATISDFPVTPNQVTIGSLVVGLCGSVCLYVAFFKPEIGGHWAWLLASLLLFGSVILDCADGQLARSRGGGSLVGRILDGVVDAVVLFPAYVILGIGIHRRYGDLWFALTAVAGFSSWAHCIVYDKLKNLYLSNTSAESHNGTETLESVQREYDEARRSGSILERVLLRIYVGYLGFQSRLAGAKDEPGDGAQAPAGDEDFARFRERNFGTMRMASWLGLGTHMLLIYLSIAVASLFPQALLATQAIFAFGFNAVFLLVLVRSRAFYPA